MLDKMYFEQPRQSGKTQVLEDRIAYLELTEFKRWKEKRDIAASKIHRLSPREQVVLLKASQGKTTRATAAEMDVTLKTIERFRSLIMKKLKVTSIHEAIVIHTEANFGK